MTTSTRSAVALLALQTFLFLLFHAAPTVAETRTHSSHTHGIGHLNIAIEGSDIYAEVKSPAANIVGFEHQPETRKQEEALSSAIGALKAGGQLFIFTPKAGCKMTSSEIISDLEENHLETDATHENHDKHEAKDGHHEEETVHGDFEAQYRFTCEQPKKLRSIKMAIFSTFPLLEQLQTQMSTPKGQTAMVLDHDKDVIEVQLQ